MQERESSNDIIIAKLEEKFTQLLEAVNGIRSNLSNQTVQIADLDRKILTLELESEQRQKEIDKLKDKHDANRKWILGIVASVVGGVAVAIVKILIGV
jgi:DNA repair exonuclease SbcCD ATPase subunit